MANDKLENYFRGQQVSLQWLPVLRALAAEMSQQSEASDLRRLFANVGQRLAADTCDLFQDAKSLTELEEALNDFWMRINWGWVEFAESESCVEICHYASPLSEAFGEDALAWSIGLFEGFYQSVFHGLGASEVMTVQAVDGASAGMDVRLNFGRSDI